MPDLLREVVADDKTAILAWRNHPDVRRGMYTKHIITPQEHEDWFQRSILDDSKRLLIYERDGIGKGFVAFYNIAPTQSTADWAFYSGDLQTRGIGSGMERVALQFAFQTLNIEKLSCEVLDFNESVIRLHQKFGFQIEGRFRKHHLHEGIRIDVLRMAIFKKDWQRVAGPAKPMPFKIGDQFTFTTQFNNEQIDEFAKVTGDLNPIHMNDSAARQAGFKSRIVHGMLVASSLSRVLATNLPGPGTIFKSQTLEFIKPVYPGDSLMIQVVVRSVVESRVTLDTFVSDEMSHMVLISGTSLVIYRHEK